VHGALERGVPCAGLPRAPGKRGDSAGLGCVGQGVADSS